MKLKFTFLATSLFIFAANAQADCRPETVINSDGTSSVQIVCDNGGSSFTPGGTGGSCSTVVIPGRGAVVLCK